MGASERTPVRVPVLVGVEVVPAYRIALIAGVAMTGHNPDTPLPLRGVINAQHPAAGTSLRSGDPVTVWLRPAGAGIVVGEVSE